jgi:hypothetical protein
MHTQLINTTRAPELISHPLAVGCFEVSELRLPNAFRTWFEPTKLVSTCSAISPSPQRHTFTAALQLIDLAPMFATFVHALATKLPTPISIDSGTLSTITSALFRDDFGAIFAILLSEITVIT